MTVSIRTIMNRVGCVAEFPKNSKNRFFSGRVIEQWSSLNLGPTVNRLAMQTTVAFVQATKERLKLRQKERKPRRFTRNTLKNAI